MKLAWSLRLFLALGSGFALALAFPNYNLSLLSWIAIGLLLLACLGVPPWPAALLGFVQGLVFAPMTVPWIYTVMRRYGNLSIADAAGVLALMSLTWALFPAAFAFCISAVGRTSPRHALVLAPFLWVALEFARTHLPIIGFPWNLIGYAPSGNLGLAQVVSWSGIYGLSLIVVAFNSLLGWAILTRSRRAWGVTGVATVLLILAATVGARVVPMPIPHYRAHLVQTDFPQAEEYPPNWMKIHANDMRQLEDISVSAARRLPGLIIWPEVPAPFSLQDPAFASQATEIAKASGSDFLVGVVDWKVGPKKNWLASNSAVLLDPAGQQIFTYDKIHLVPFGEYVPLRRWIKFARALTANISDFTPGSQYMVGELPGGRFGVFICYEAIFPAEVRQFVAHGAELLINISNDGWFGRSAAPAQHLKMARMRAIENRRWLLRDTNNGFTVDIDPYGRIVARLAPDVRGQLEAPYDFRSDRTLYSRWGDWLAWLCVAACAALLGTAIARAVSRR